MRTTGDKTTEYNTCTGMLVCMYVEGYASLNLTIIKEMWTLVLKWFMKLEGKSPSVALISSTIRTKVFHIDLVNCFVKQVITDKSGNGVATRSDCMDMHCPFFSGTIFTGRVSMRITVVYIQPESC